MPNLETNFLLDHGYLLYDNFFNQNITNPINELLDTALQKSGIPTSPETARKWISEKSKLQKNKLLLDQVNEGPAQYLLRKIIGPMQKVKSCQIAFRFPKEKTNDDTDYWHIDNYTERDFKRKSGIPKDFTCLVGIYLDDNLENDSGNFTVWSGQHHRLQTWSRNNGGHEYYEKNGLNKMKEVFRQNELKTKLFQIKASRGSLIIVHRMLLHTMGSNEYDKIRKVVWFRMSKDTDARKNNKNLDPETYMDIWKEWCVNIKSIPYVTCNQNPEIKNQIKKIEEMGYGYQYDYDKNSVTLRIRPSVALHGEPCMFASMVTVKYYTDNNRIEVHTNGFISRPEHNHMANDIRKVCISTNKNSKLIDLFKVSEYIQRLNFEQMICKWYPYNKSENDSYETIYKIMKFAKIMSRSKGGMMERWGNELGLKGGLLLGRPGYCIIVGSQHNIDIFMKRFGCFHWKKMNDCNIEIDVMKIKKGFFRCLKEYVPYDYLKQLFLSD